MRTHERYGYTFSACLVLFVLYCNSSYLADRNATYRLDQAKALLAAPIGIHAVLGIREESVRGAQLPSLAGYGLYIATHLITAGDYAAMVTFIAFAIGTCLSISLWWFYGECDFTAVNEIAMTGPYGVGCRRFWTKKKGNHVLVFYPISKA